MDGVITKAPLGGEKTGKNPTDRAKTGTKHSLLTDGRGIPLGISVADANCHDKNMVAYTFKSIPIMLPYTAYFSRHNLCMDKGYDYPDVRVLVEEWGYTAHIKSRGEESNTKKQIPAYRARRWVVERTHSWMNKLEGFLSDGKKKYKITLPCYILLVLG